MRILDNECLQVSQGRRKGSFAVYLQPWHPEIMTFLQVRLPTAPEEIKCGNIFTALWSNELFMERVQKKEMYSLFCPSKVNLIDCYGKEFREKYLEAERKGLYEKQIPAQDIYLACCESRQEAGVPYIFNKDAINEKNAQKNIGSIRCSNLCGEIVEYTDDTNIAVCNLTSIALPRFVVSSSPTSGGATGNGGWEFDFKHLGEIVENCTVNCDRIIDINLYPVKDTKRANKHQRPIGIGVQGLSDVYQMMGYSWESKEARRLNISIFSTIYYHFLKATCVLSKKYGPYPGFRGSPASQGILQYHMWGVEPDTSVISREQWRGIEEEIKRYGMRNSMGIALMPTATTSQILGNTESIEVMTYNVYLRGTLAGTFYQINKHLYATLKRLGMWNDRTVAQIIKDRGSVRNLPISKDLKVLFKTVWELSQKYVVDQSADRGPYIDQTQSLNIHLEKPTVAQLSSLDKYSFDKGLKTIAYYTRSKASMDAVMFTIMEDRVGEILKDVKREATTPVSLGEMILEDMKRESSLPEDARASSRLEDARASSRLDVCYKGCESCSA